MREFRRGNCLLTVGGSIGDGDQLPLFFQENGPRNTIHHASRCGLPRYGTHGLSRSPNLNAVKQALVAAQGTDNFVFRGSSVGGVRSAFQV